jgi:signal transduction histidine kinase
VLKRACSSIGEPFSTRASTSASALGRVHAHAAFSRFNDFIERWVRHRYALPMAVSLAIALLVVSEHAYRDTTTAMRGAVELSEARIMSVRLLQLLTDAEAAHYGYLVTGQPQYLTRHADAKAELAQVQPAMAAFLTNHGADGAEAAQWVADFTQRELTRFDRTLALAQAGKPVEAAELARTDQRDMGMQALRTEIFAQLAHTNTRLQQARHNMQHELLVNRLGVGLLTLGTLFLLFLFVRQLGRFDRERSRQRRVLLDERARLEIEATHRTAQLAALARHLQTAREDERASLARELHDELGGLLTASKLDIARARKKVGEPAELLASLERINGHLNEGIALKRRIIEDLHPSALTNLGLTAALDILCREVRASLAMPVRLSAAEVKMSPEASLAVYRFVQEALTNIGKYAAATHVEVALAVVDSNVTVEVRDDGVGFVVEQSHAGHHGLAGMKFRAETLGGAMRVISRPGQGTTVSIAFPQGPVPATAAPSTPARGG